MMNQQSSEARIRSHVEVSPTTEQSRPEKRARTSGNDQDVTGSEQNDLCTLRDEGKSNRGEGSRGLDELDASQAKPTTATSTKHVYDEGMFVFDEDLPNGEELPEQVRSAVVLYNTALQNVRVGKFYEARRWFELASVRIAINTRDEEAEMMLVKTHHNLGHCLYRLGRSHESMRAYQKALSHAKGAGEVAMAASASAIAVLLFHKDAADSDKALKLLRDTLKVYREQLGRHNRRVATTLNNMGRVLYMRGEFTEALDVYAEALEIRRSIDGVAVVDLAATICNTGQTYHQLGDLNQAMNYYEEYLRLAEGPRGAGLRDISVIYKCVAEIYHERGHIDAGS